MASKWQLKKAVDWLEARRKDGGCWPVYGTRNGCAAFVAYIFKIHRDGKPSVYYVVKMKAEWEIESVKRFCLY